MRNKNTTFSIINIIISVISLAFVTVFWIISKNTNFIKISGAAIITVLAISIILQALNLISHEKTKKSIKELVQISKEYANGIFSGTGLSKTQEHSFEKSIKHACINIQNDSQFFQSVKEQINL